MIRGAKSRGLLSGIDSVFRRGLDSLSLRIAVTLRTLSRISTGRTLMEGESVWSTREAVVVVVEEEEDVATLETGTGADLVEGG